MFGWLLRRQLAAFERRYDYDMGYARDLLDADAGALLKFSKVMGMAQYRREVAPDAWYAAKLVATLAEDCGPCTQLVVTMAEREGVPPDVLRAVLEGDLSAMPDGVSLSYRFSKAVLSHDVEADRLREQVVERWGKKALVSLAFAITAARIFPTLKYALGHGRACTRVTVAGGPVQVEHAHQA